MKRRRPSFIALLRSLVRKRDAGEITPQQFAERKTRIVTARIIFREVKDERKRA